jgi:hypothetical protein
MVKNNKHLENIPDVQDNQDNQDNLNREDENMLLHNANLNLPASPPILFKQRGYMLYREHIYQEQEIDKNRDLEKN